MSRKRECNRKPGNSRCIKKIEKSACPSEKCAKTVKAGAGKNPTQNCEKSCASTTSCPKHCKECYCTLLDSEKSCPVCLSDNIACSVVDEVQEEIRADGRLCRENPPVTYGYAGCFIGKPGQHVM